MAKRRRKQPDRKQLGTELVGSFAGSWLLADQGLPHTIDDAEALFGMDIYDRMLTSPDIQGIFNILRSAVLEQGWIVSPPMAKPLHGADPEEQAEFDQAEEIATFVRDQLEGLAIHGMRSFYSILWEGLGCLAKGHILAEITYRAIDKGKHAGKLGLKSIKTKPRQNYALVVDPYNNFLGVTARQPGRQFIVRVGFIGDAHNVPSFIGRDKLVLFNWDLKDDDPRGTSLLRGCYRPWKKDQIIDPESVKYAAQFGGGRILITRGDQGVGNVGAAKDETNEAVLEKGKKWGSGGVLVLEHGASAGVVMPETDTKIFSNAITEVQKRYALAITTSIRACLEAEHGSKADSAQGDKLLDAFIGTVAEHFEPIVTAQIVRPLVLFNFGEDAAEKYLPVFTLRSGGKDDFASNATAVSDLVDAGIITQPMKAVVARDKFGLEYEPDEEAPEKEKPLTDPEEEGQ